MTLSREKRAALMGSSYFRKIMEYEEALYTLYSCFASAFPGSKDFWLEIAQEELRHKQMAMVLSQKTKSGEYGFRRPDFVYSSLTDGIRFVTDIIQRAQTRGISMREALALAVKAESGSLESQYMEIIDEDTESAKKILNILRKDTAEHLQKIKEEAGRFKWRIFGGKIHKPDSQFEFAQRNMKDEAKQAQTEILDCLVSLEESLNTLYNTFQAVLKDPDDFWSKIAAEEMQHATMLKSLYSYLQNGHLFQNIGKFNKEDIISRIDQILDLEYKARERSISMQDALNNALALETNLCDSSFYAIVESDAPEFRIICQRMNTLLAGHRQRLQDKILAFQKEKKENVNWV